MTGREKKKKGGRRKHKENMSKIRVKMKKIRDNRKKTINNLKMKQVLRDKIINRSSQQLRICTGERYTEKYDRKR